MKPDAWQVNLEEHQTRRREPGLRIANHALRASNPSGFHFSVFAPV
jgi:hypothetical protein